jgi:hypothetical protein
LSGLEIVNLDPTKSSESFDLDQNNASLVIGRDAYMIRMADVVIVNLTDDISVGGSQEMLIAKYFQKPLIGLAPRGGKFNRDEKEFFGRTFKNYTDPFVTVTCDAVAENVDELAGFIPNLLDVAQGKKTKDISVLDEALKYYKKNHHVFDTYLTSLEKIV